MSPNPRCTNHGKIYSLMTHNILYFLWISVFLKRRILSISWHCTDVCQPELVKVISWFGPVEKTLSDALMIKLIETYALLGRTRLIKISHFFISLEYSSMVLIHHKSILVSNNWGSINKTSYHSPHRRVYACARNSISLYYLLATLKGHYYGKRKTLSL